MDMKIKFKFKIELLDNFKEKMDSYIFLSPLHCTVFICVPLFQLTVIY